MRRATVAALVALVAALALVGAGAGSTTSGDDIKIGFSTWNGYLALVVGVKSGLFEKAGVKVDYTVIEDPVQRFNALKAGSLNAIATTVDTFSREAANGIQTVEVLGLDASAGGDGIVAEKSITKVKQLEGQSVAVSEGSTSQWFLAYVLQKNGMSLDDVKQINLTSGDAGAAFAAGKVPVAVTWQPWLDRAKANPKGHVLISSKRYPTIIVDEVAFAPSYVEQHPDGVRKFIAGYDAAMHLIRTNPKKAFSYVTDYLGQTPKEIEATMKDVPLWTVAQSKRYYGTAKKPGPIYDVYAKSAQFWKQIGETHRIPSAKKGIDPSFVAAYKG